MLCPAGKPLFGTLISLLEAGKPILGIIDQPITGERWLGAHGRPTTLNGEAPLQQAFASNQTRWRQNVPGADDAYPGNSNSRPCKVSNVIASANLPRLLPVTIKQCPCPSLATVGLRCRQPEWKVITSAAGKEIGVRTCEDLREAYLYATSPHMFMGDAAVAFNRVRDEVNAGFAISSSCSHA